LALPNTKPNLHAKFSSTLHSNPNSQTTPTPNCEYKQTIQTRENMLLHPVLSLSPFPSLVSNRSHRFRPRRRHFAPRRAVQCAASASGGDDFTAKSGYLFELSATEADSLAEYRIPTIAAIYWRKPLLVARRLVQTGLAFGKWFGLRYIDTLMDRSESMFQVS